MYKVKWFFIGLIFNIKSHIMRRINLRKDKNKLSHGEFDWLICKTFPKLYADRHASMTTTCLCWGFEIGKGWQQLVWDLSEKLEAEIAKQTLADMPCRASQVKSKYAGLRFYMTASTDAMDKLISEAEERSSSVCEECGLPGDVYGSSWITCYCEDCARKRSLFVKTKDMP